MSEPNWFDVSKTETPRSEMNQKLAYMTSVEAASPSPSAQMPLTGKVTGWADVGSGRYMATVVTCMTLPAGCYRPVPTNIGMTLQEMPLASDEILSLPDSQSLDVVKEITRFKERADEFKKRRLLHKRGVMLWGPPGSGKTCTIGLVIKLLVEEHGGIAIYADSPQLAESLRMARGVEKDRQIVVIMEDLDALVNRYGEAEWLAILDGESQVDNIVYVATTNYPERLDKRFTDRPSRFDTIKYIGMPSKDARRFYLEAKESEWKESDLREIVNGTEGMSIAHLREILILNKCMGYPVAESIKRIADMHKKLPDSEKSPERTTLGFAMSNGHEL